MGLFGPSKRELRGRLEALEARSSLENPAVSLSDVDAWNAAFGWWSGKSSSGATVNVESALGVPAFWAAVNFLSSTIASLPLDLYLRADDGRQTADKDPLFAILHDAPNAEMSSFAWRKRAMISVLTKGRSFTFIERNKARRVMNLWQLDPAKTTVRREAGRTIYTYKEGGKTSDYAAEEIIDIVWMPGFDGISHFDPIERLKNAIGLSIALEEYGAQFFESGGVPPLQLVGPLNSPGAVARAATDIMEALKEAKKEGRPILPMPLMHELKQIGFDPQKGQMTEARRFQLEEFARIFQLPPVFLQDLTHGTFSNTEQQDLHFVKHTLTGWLKAWEQELNLKLFSARNRKNFVEFNIDGLLRGDFRTRMEGYGKALQTGINTPNEIRRMENWPDYGDAADRLYMQGAMLPIDKLGETPAEPQAAGEPVEADEEEQVDDPATA